MVFLFLSLWFSRALDAVGSAGGGAGATVKFTRACGSCRCRDAPEAAFVPCSSGISGVARFVQGSKQTSQVIGPETLRLPAGLLVVANSLLLGKVPRYRGLPIWKCSYHRVRYTPADDAKICQPQGRDFLRLPSPSISSAEFRSGCPFAAA